MSALNYKLIKSLTEGLNHSEYKLFCHLLISTFTHYRQVHRNNKGWLSITAKFIAAKFRKALPRNLEKHGLIHIDRQYLPGKHPRRYKVQDWIVDSYIDNLHRAETKEGPVNLLNGKPYKNLQSRPDSYLAPADTPPLIQKAVSCFSVCYYDREGVLQHLSLLRAAYQRDRTDASRFRYINDVLCFEAIERFSHPVPELSHIYAFSPAYTVQSTGRISTPLQSASRAMKRAAYASIPNVFNYDLSSSQVTLCLYEMSKHGIACPWLESYLSDKGKRVGYAAFIGISEDAWKTCLCTVLMGGCIPSSVSWGKETAIIQTLCDEVGENENAIKEALNRLRQVLSPLMAPLQQWHKKITTETAMAGYANNAISLFREYKDFRNPKKSSIVAHILQGIEAYFIHTLTAIAVKHNFIPLGNEHDGLITLWCIPQEAIEEAKELTGLQCLELRQKPFNA